MEPAASAALACVWSGAYMWLASTCTHHNVALSLLHSVIAPCAWLACADTNQRCFWHRWGCAAQALGCCGLAWRTAATPARAPPALGCGCRSPCGWGHSRWTPWRRRWVVQGARALCVAACAQRCAAQVVLGTAATSWEGDLWGASHSSAHKRVLRTSAVCYGVCLALQVRGESPQGGRDEGWGARAFILNQFVPVSGRRTWAACNVHRQQAVVPCPC